MQTPLSRKKRIIYFMLFVLAFIAIIPALLLYSSGYSFDETFNLSWRGGIYVYVAEPGVDVYIGNDLKRTTGLFAREVLTKNLRPDTYLVLAANDGYWPWAKFVEVKKGEVSARFPLLVPKKIEFEEIEKGTARYTALNSIFIEKTKIPIIGPVSPLVLSELQATTTLQKATSTLTEGLTRKQIRIWIEKNNVYAEWNGDIDSRPYYFCNGYVEDECPKKIKFLEGVETIKRIDFYPGRDDAIMLTIGSGIYATEIDPNQYHNFYPIFRGKNPDFRIDGDTVYIKDGDYIAVAEI